jgi:hypothetical protein
MGFRFKNSPPAHPGEPLLQLLRKQIALRLSQLILFVQSRLNFGSYLPSILGVEDHCIVETPRIIVVVAADSPLIQSIIVFAVAARPVRVDKLLVRTRAAFGREASSSPCCFASYSSSSLRLKSSALSQLRVLALRRMKGPSDPRMPLIHFGQRQRL